MEKINYKNQGSRVKGGKLSSYSGSPPILGGDEGVVIRRSNHPHPSSTSTPPSPLSTSTPLNPLFNKEGKPIGRGVRKEGVPKAGAFDKEGKPQGREVKKLLLFLFTVLSLAAPAHALDISDYTAYPPFLPRVTSPNILFMLDYSESMVKPAYGTCTSLSSNEAAITSANCQNSTDSNCLSNCRTKYSNLTYDYDSSATYSGYYDTTSGSNKYNCADGSSCAKDSSGVWSGNFLNWLTMTQFDIMKKVTVGGDITPAPEQGNPGKVRSVLTSGYSFRKQMDLPSSGNSSSCSSSDSPECTQWPTPTSSWLSNTGTPPLCTGTNNTTSTGCYLWSSSATTTSYDNYVTTAQTLPFPFTFYGTTYNQIYIGTNGLLSFDPALANNISLLNDDVESGAGSWTTSDGPSGSSLWHRETDSTCNTPQSGSAMWYYGQNSTCTFDNTATNSGYLTSGSMSLPAGRAAQLSFWYATKTEGGTWYDARYVQISDNGGAWTDLAQITDEDDPLIWRQKVIDLTAYAGHSIQIRFSFNTRDAIGNAHKGWFIDDIDVTSSAAASASTDNINLDLPESASPNALIAPYWDDLIVKGKNTGAAADKWTSKVYTFTSGTAPNRIFVVTYENVRHKLDEAATDTTKNITFQVLLYEGSNHIVFQYSDVKGTTTYGGGKSATIGIENNDGSGAKKKSYCTACGSAAVANGDIIFAAPHISYTITAAGGGSGVTLFQPAAPLTTASNDYNVYIDISSVAGYPNCPTGSYPNSDRGTCYNHETLGLLQDFRDGELGGTLGFRLAIMQLNGSSSVKDGGSVVKHFNAKDTTGWSSLMNATRGQTPTTVTPLAEALQIAEGYFKQDTTYDLGLSNPWTNDGTGSTCASTGTNYDPYCFQSAAQRVSCCKSFVLIASSGNYSNDNRTNIYGDAADTNAQLIAGAWRTTPDETSGQEGILAKGGWLDNVAYKAHTTDWRSDLGTSGEAPGQNLTIYAVNTFGSASGNGMGVLKRAAKFGGFEDADGDNAYDSGEDDNDGDGNPDTYFEASGGSDLKSTIIDAVTEIMKSSASGTSVSVLSTSAGGEGAIYQAYFYPARLEGDTDERTWPGFLRAFFLDKYENLRDDSGGGSYQNCPGASCAFSGTQDAKLIMANDRIAQMYLDETTSEVKAKVFSDSDGLLPDQTWIDANSSIVTMDQIASIWEGGQKLALRDKSTRKIFTWLNTGGTTVSSTTGGFSSIGGTPKDFTTSEATSLKYYLRAQAGDVDGAGTTYNAFTADKEAEYIIRFIRGEAITPTTTSSDGTGVSYRNRCITISGATQESGCTESNQRVWALGDVVYSTPSLVGGPGEQYDLLYGDADYKAFRIKYQNRRRMVYVGGNDGMLHAFNAGVYTSGDDTSTEAVESGRFAANPSSGNGWTSPTPEIGDELWAFIPHDNLPHLGWLACNGTSTDPVLCGSSEYTHVYYVDARPKVTDARIFTADTDHPGGWGTIMIMSMRLGGGAIDVDLNGDGDTGDAGENGFRSAYYAFDITDPEKKPRLLWRFYDSNLGFTTSYPAIARICTTKDVPCSGTEKWYMVVGNGSNNRPAIPQAPSVRDYGGNSTTLTGKVFVVDLSDVTSVATFDTSAPVTPNEYMGDPLVVDEDLVDFSSDVIYIGSSIQVSGSSTITGKVYRIQTNGGLASTWTPSLLFNTTKPMLIPPSVAKDTEDNLWVFFGTGRLRNQDDLINSDQQSFYGIKDECGKSGATCATGYAQADLLNTSTITVDTASSSTQVKEGVGGVGCEGSGSSTASSCAYNTLKETVDAKKGWYLNLENSSTPSERVLSRAGVLGGVVLFTTYIPVSDMCSIFGDSRLYALNYETGTAYSKSVVGTTSEISGIGDDTSETSGTYISKSVELGKGMPTAVGIAVGEKGMTGFVQKSTGEIIRIEAEPGMTIKSGAASWREKTGGGGTSGIETIYKHIGK